MQFGLIAETLKHSFSKEIHAQFADYDYKLCEIPQEEFDAFMKKRDFCGINVTIPYKQAVIPYLDEISDEAARIGAVNTIVNRGGKLYGYNTDFFGMRALIERTGISVGGKKVAVLGTGGTSKTAECVAESLGAASVIKVSRAKKQGCVTYDELYGLHGDTEVVINTTPCGMFPNSDDCPVDIEKLPSLMGVIDAVYNPLNTRLVLAAKSRGISAAGGLYMLVAQAAGAVKQFIGKDISNAQIGAAFDSIMGEKLNIVLVGMPSCGKTTLGLQLAKAMNKEFIDTDKVIVQRHGVIGKIFEKQGENGFRDIEAAVIKEIAAENGAVIATGGGAVLRKENVEQLSKNGIIVFIDRALEKLCGTPDRPLSKNSEQMKKLYDERRPIYLAAADIVFKPTEDISDNVLHIRSAVTGGDEK